MNTASIAFRYFILILLTTTVGCSDISDNSSARWAPDVKFVSDKLTIRAGEPLTLDWFINTRAIDSWRETLIAPPIGELVEAYYRLETNTGNIISIKDDNSPIARDEIGGITLFPNSGGMFTVIAKDRIVVPKVPDYLPEYSDSIIHEYLNAIREERDYETRKTITIDYDDNFDISQLATQDSGLANCFDRHQGATVAEISHLDCSGDIIADISALRYLKNLDSLVLDLTHVHDLTPLQVLVSLNTVDVAASTGNCASQFDLYGLYENTHVEAIINQMICPLDARKRVESIVFSDASLDRCFSGIRDGEPSKYTYGHEIKALSCRIYSSLSNGVNFLEEIKQLIGLRRLTLILDGSQSWNVSPLTDLANLTELSIEGGRLQNIHSIGELQLSSLSLINSIDQTDLSDLFSTMPNKCT